MLRASAANLDINMVCVCSEKNKSIPSRPFSISNLFGTEHSPHSTFVPKGPTGHLYHGFVHVYDIMGIFSALY